MTDRESKPASAINAGGQSEGGGLSTLSAHIIQQGAEESNRQPPLTNEQLAKALVDRYGLEEAKRIALALLAEEEAFLAGVAVLWATRRNRET